MMALTTSIAAMSSACWCKSMARLPRGGTKNQLNPTTAIAPLAAPAQAGSHSEAIAQASTTTIARLARSTCPSSTASSAAPTPQAGSAGQASRSRQGAPLASEKFTPAR